MLNELLPAATARLLLYTLPDGIWRVEFTVNDTTYYTAGDDADVALMEALRRYQDDQAGEGARYWIEQQNEDRRGWLKMSDGEEHP